MSRTILDTIGNTPLVVILPDGGERYLSTSLFAVRNDIGLKFFNTLSKKKETFEPLVPGVVSVYSYGPTAHDRMHIGEMRRYVFVVQQHKENKHPRAGVQD
jgi:cysteinyl-tRNA synthetase